MDNHNSKAILKKYKFCSLGILFVFLASVIAIYRFTENNILYGLSILAGIFVLRVFRAILYGKLINSVLYNELNLPKYIDLINTGKIISTPLLEHMYIAYYSGDYNKAINICKTKLEDKKCNNFKHYYLLILARCYFDIGDMENLNSINDAFKGYVMAHARGNKMKEKFYYFKFVDFYLSGDFSAARALYEGLYSEQNKKPGKNRINDLAVTFTYAVCCYKCGDFDKAAELFNEVIAMAPSFHYAEMSKRYLEAIENNTDYIPEQITIDANTADIPTPKSNKKLKVLYTIGIFLIIFSIIFSVIDTITAPKQPIHFKGIDYRSTQSDVHSIYGEPDKVIEFDSSVGQCSDFYNVEYLGVKATQQFIYYIDSDILYNSRITIDSTRFSSYAEYESAVDRTYGYFANTLTKYRIVDKSDEDGRDIIWFNDKDRYYYRMFEADLTFSSKKNNVSKCTVFEFCKYNE